MKNIEKHSILILGSHGESTNLVYNALKNDFKVTVILEKHIAASTIVKGRIKKLGIATTIGQLLFLLIIPKLLLLFATKRRKEIYKTYNLNGNEIPKDRLIYIDSVNGSETISIVNCANPSIILVNGTRIISKKIIQEISTPMINIHTGITPLYRGVHGGYWALYSNDTQNFGTTLHFIDEGIDTGKVIRYYKVQPDKSDSYITYPLLQYAIIYNELPTLLYAIINGNNSDIPNSLPTSEKGKIWFHPTLIEYLTGRFKYGIK